MIFFIELLGITIAILAILLLARPKPVSGYFLARILLIAVTSWMMEESAIVLYRFYSYNPAWHLWLDQVPVMVVITWPIIIHSAWDLSSQMLHNQYKFIPFAAALIVATDAFFIEPIATHAGLWSWNYPGLFKVPFIAISGWAYYAFLWIYCLTRKRTRYKIEPTDFLQMILIIAGTHLLLLLSWCLFMRWVSLEFNSFIVICFAWFLSLLFVLTFLGKNFTQRVERRTLLLRLPAALFFFTLIFLNFNHSLSLLLYATAFVPPYLILMLRANFVDKYSTGE